MSRQERRRLVAADRRSARLAELHLMIEILDDAEDLVSANWVQHGWFAFRDERGRRQVAIALALHRMAGRPVEGACLVGAVVQGGGGPERARTQLVQRTLDLVWHTRFRGTAEPVRWCPGPVARAAQVRELTRWNDQPGRTATEVATLLAATRAAVLRELDRVRAAPQAVATSPLRNAGSVHE
jgi:hypothetical protein